MRASRSAHALTALRGVPDEALERAVAVARSSRRRYGFYRQFEALEAARSSVGPMVAAARASETAGRPIVAGAAAARWDLHGLIAPLTDDDLDRDPGGGEWTLRQTLAHMVSGQRGTASSPPGG